MPPVIIRFSGGIQTHNSFASSRNKVCIWFIALPLKFILYNRSYLGYRTGIPRVNHQWTVILMYLESRLNFDNFACWFYIGNPITGRQVVNTLRPRQDAHRFPDDTFKRIFLIENVIILIKISLKLVPNGPIDNIPALVQIMARRRPGDKPLSEPMMVRLPTHICVTRPQWGLNSDGGHL